MGDRRYLQHLTSYCSRLARRGSSKKSHLSGGGGGERWLVSGRRPGWTGDRNSRARPFIRSPPPHYSHVSVILGAKEVLGIAKEIIDQHVLV